MTEIVIAIIGSGALSAIIAGVFNLINNRSKNKNAEVRLLMGIAYSEIIEQAQKYISRGYITIDEYKELEHYFYEPYQALGGNGTAEKLMKEVSLLPTKEGLKIEPNLKKKGA